MGYMQVDKDDRFFGGGIAYGYSWSFPLFTVRERHSRTAAHAPMRGLDGLARLGSLGSPVTGVVRGSIIIIGSYVKS